MKEAPENPMKLVSEYYSENYCRLLRCHDHHSLNPSHLENIPIDLRSQILTPLMSVQNSYVGAGGCAEMAEVLIPRVGVVVSGVVMGDAAEVEAHEVTLASLAVVERE